MARLIDLENAMDISTLYDWYITSVSQDDEPVWTEKHIDELFKDFYVIPKETSVIEAETVKQEWIDVHDRLPDKDTLVLCVGAKGGMFLGFVRYLYGDDKTAYVRVPNARGGRYAAFWIPLPEPPEKE